MANLSQVARHMSPGQASKDGKLEETFNMENALMQQPSHICSMQHDGAWRSTSLDIFVDFPSLICICF